MKQRPMHWADVLRWHAHQVRPNPEFAKDLLLEFCAAFEAGEAPPSLVMGSLNRAFLEVLGLGEHGKEVPADQALGLTARRGGQPAPLKSPAWAEERLPLWRELRRLEIDRPGLSKSQIVRHAAQAVGKTLPRSGSYRKLWDEYDGHGRRTLEERDAVDDSLRRHLRQRLCALLRQYVSRGGVGAEGS